MIYILCAFEIEARALIDHYKLHKRVQESYKCFYNEELTIFITGMGQEHAQKATQTLFKTFSIQKDDAFINLGICAGQADYEIGTLLQIKSLSDGEQTYALEIQESEIPSVSCFSAKAPQSQALKEDIAEMEAMGIYLALQEASSSNPINFLKIVSDHFKPSKMDKAFVHSLIQQNLIPIKQHISQLKKRDV